MSYQSLELAFWLLGVLVGVVIVLRPDIIIGLLFVRKKATLHDQQARFTFSNPNPKTKAPLNAKN